MPKVSVIIPTYNRERYVVKAIDSILNQQYDDHEIIVVDDGSTDNTKEKLESYRGKITYIYQVNSGVSAARNAGFQNAEGEWLAFLDSDDEWLPDYLSTQMEKVNQVPGICMQTTNCRVKETDGREITYFEMNGALAEFNGKDYLFLEKPFLFIMNHLPWQVGPTLILKEAAKRAGLFDRSLKISEDIDFLARMALQGPLGIINKTLVNIYKRNENIEALTKQAERNPIWGREVNERVYQKLRSIETLGRQEIRALNRLISANRRAIGNLLLKDGKKREAKDCYKRAFFIDPSPVSLGKYILSCFPTKKS